MLLNVIRGALASAGRTVQGSKGAHWPQNAKKGDIHEANYALHVAHALHARSAHVYFEVPIVSGERGRLDLLAIHEAEAWALAIEFKCLASQAKDALIEYDVQKLDGLRPRRSSGTVDVVPLRCFTALAASSWQPRHEAWWCEGPARSAAPPRAKRPDSWAAIGRFLAGAGADGVGAVDLTVNAKYPHRLLYAIRAEPDAGVFWRE